MLAETPAIFALANVHLFWVAVAVSGAVVVVLIVGLTVNRVTRRDCRKAG